MRCSPNRRECRGLDHDFLRPFSLKREKGRCQVVLLLRFDGFGHLLGGIRGR
jgi:hypothetical protein